MQNLASKTGLLESTAPELISPGLLVVTETALRSMSLSQVQALFEMNDLHVVPDSGQPDPGFNSITCKTLGIDLDVLRDFHGEFEPPARQLV